MADAIGRSVAIRGPIDIVLSCCAEFPEALNEGLSWYALTIAFEHLPRYFQSQKSMTSGPRGLAEICEAAKARWFLPYAHGFAGLGKDPSSPESRDDETQLRSAVSEALAERKVATEILAWNPGDRMIWRKGRPVIQSFPDVSE